MGEFILNEGNELVVSTLDAIADVAKELDNNEQLKRLPEAQNVMAEIGKLFQTYNNLEGVEDQDHANDLLQELFKFSEQANEIAQKATKYKYSIGNIALLAIQGVKDPDQWAPLTHWLYNGMQPKKGAHVRIISKPVVSKEDDFTYVDTIKADLGKEVTKNDIKTTEFKNKVNIDSGTIGDYFRAYIGKPGDYDISSYFNTDGGRNFIAHFILSNFGLKSNLKDQGWLIAAVYNENDVEPIPIPGQKVKRGTEEPLGDFDAGDVQKVEHVFGGLKDLIFHIDKEEQKNRDFAFTIFRDMLGDMKALIENPKNVEASLDLFTRLLEFQSNINQLRQRSVGYPYSMRNLMLLAMQDPNMTQFGPTIYWFNEGMKPKEGAEARIILKPITKDNPMKLAHEIKDRPIERKDIVRASMLKAILASGVDFENQQYTIGHIYNIFYGQPGDHNFTLDKGWEYNLASFYLQLTGLEDHLTRGYSLSRVYDITQVEPIPGVEPIDKDLIPPAAQDETDGNDPERVKLMQSIVIEIMKEFKAAVPASSAAEETVYKYCIHGKEVAPYLKRKDDQGNLENTPLKLNLSQETTVLGKLIHRLVHQISHVQKPGKSSNEIVSKMLKGLNATKNSRLYYNPKMNAADKQGIQTQQTLPSILRRESQAEAVTGLILKAMGITSENVTGDLALLSAVDTQESNTPINELMHYLGVANAIINRVNQKLEARGEKFAIGEDEIKSINEVVDQILKNKDLLK